MVNMDELRAATENDTTYPTAHLTDCRDALVLFAAAFGGRQDAYWIAQAGLQATCVDHDDGLLGAMVLAYPHGWEYVHADAFLYASTTARLWDVVSIDCPTNLFGACADALPLWCELARKLVVLGSDDRTLTPPAGWEMVERRFRSANYGGVYWQVLRPC